MIQQGRVVHHTCAKSDKFPTFAFLLFQIAIDMGPKDCHLPFSEIFWTISEYDSTIIEKVYAMVVSSV